MSYIVHTFWSMNIHSSHKSQDIRGHSGIHNFLGQQVYCIQLIH
uniref:Uncharacterized protein n=1 Tax=Setaria italica TaxID=4555 RepID=K3ZPC8_SETIT